MLRVLSSTVQSETKRTCKASFSSLIANFKAFDISTASSLGYCDPSRSRLNLHEFKCINIHEQSPNIQSVTNQHSSTTRFRYETMMTARRAFSSMAMTSKERVDTDDEREIVQYVTLNTLADNPGATKKKRRVGRGIGSSKGKTCGRGHKGQKSRSGGKRKINSGFEGGQTKLYKRIPKRGFSNKMHAQPMVPINLGDLQDYIDMKRLPTSNLIQMNDLVAAGLTKMNSVKFGIKLLAKGKERFRTPIQIQVSRASKEAIEAIEKVGGEITTVHYTPLSLRALMKPHKFKGEVLPKNPLPPPRLMTYYNNYENRGYLSPQVQKKQIMNRLNQGGITEEMDENNKDDA